MQSRLIPLSKGYHALVDDNDYDWLMNYSWYYNSTGYATAKVEGKDIHMQRLILGTPEGLESDHKNGDRLDNRRENLRIVTKQQNSCNKCMCSNNTSGYKGVSLHKATGKYRATIEYQKIQYHLGLFTTKEEAAKVYNNAALKMHGEFARLNIIGDAKG